MQDSTRYATERKRRLNQGPMPACVAPISLRHTSLRHWRDFHSKGNEEANQ